MKLGFGLGIGSPVVGGGPGLALSAGLVSYWKLDEASGTRADSVGSNDLTDNNTVMAVNRGPSGTVASFTSTSQTLLVDATLSPPIDVDEDWTISGWLKTSAGTAVVAVYGADGIDHSIRARGDNDTFEFAAPDGDGTASAVVAIPVETSNWNFAVIKWDATAKERRMSLNGGAYGDPSSPDDLDTFPLADFDTVTIGLVNISEEGSASSVGLWTRQLSVEEAVSLFNSGNGKRYADLTTAEKVGLVSYWNLDEASGNRADSHGSNDLTDNNIVGSVINAGAAMNGAAASFVAANGEFLSGTFPGINDDWTVSLWGKVVTTPSESNTVFSITSDEVGGDDFNINEYNGNLYLYSYNGATEEEAVSEISPNSGEWFHAIFGWQASTHTPFLWLNGVEKAITANSFTGDLFASINTTMGLGCYIAGTSQYATGAIDEVALYSRVLTSDEITELYNAGAGKFYPFEE